MNSLKDLQGVDIYLIDQLLKNVITPSAVILDAGCGTGRNMNWFVQAGFDVVGCDISEEALNEAAVRTGINPEKLTVAPLENLPYSSEKFDFVICSAVLHFAKSTDHFLTMVSELARVLKPNGMLFVRMTSDFGLPKNYTSLGQGRYLLADGSERFLLTQELFAKIKNEFNLHQIEPLKSTLVENLRSMSTLVLRKS
ncbi:MAG: class I SAM-dependent methyltransferase [Crocinitomix sp.]|nr:class I SAM-dependent methyltransferase [Crocinitomix sp.]